MKGIERCQGLGIRVSILAVLMNVNYKDLANQKETIVESPLFKQTQNIGSSGRSIKHRRRRSAVVDAVCYGVYKNGKI